MAQIALVLDDEQSLRDIISEVLSHLDIETIHADSGTTALNLAKQYPNFDVIIMDMNLPNMSGEETYNLLRKTHGNCPIIFISGYDLTDEVAAMNVAAAHTFLKKPFSIAQLAKTVKEMMG